MTADQKNPSALREQLASALLELKCEKEGCTELAVYGVACEIDLPPSATHLIGDNPRWHYHLKCEQHVGAHDAVPLSQLTHLRIKNGQG